MENEPVTERIVIHQAGDLRIEVDTIIDPAAVSLLKHTVYGTNGVRYTQTQQEDKVDQLHQPLFFHLLKGGALMGVYCLDQRPLQLATLSRPSFYGRYLAVDEVHSGKGYGRLLNQEAIRHVEQRFSEPYLFYSYIEARNSRSLRISQATGFQSAAVLKTFIFRRYTPQTDPRFARLAHHELNNLKSQLGAYYANYTFKTFSRIGFQDNYFTLKDGDEVLVGIQANPVRWRFSHMPGLRGWAMMNLLPFSSVTRRFFNPGNYAFVVLEGFYAKEGQEKLLPVLLESVLANFGVYSALWQVDQKDPVCEVLSENLMGILSGYRKDIATHVMVKSADIDKHQLHAELPFYVSCFDFA